MWGRTACNPWKWSRSNVEVAVHRDVADKVVGPRRVRVEPRDRRRHPPFTPQDNGHTTRTKTGREGTGKGARKIPPTMPEIQSHPRSRRVSCTMKELLHARAVNRGRADIATLYYSRTVRHCSWTTRLHMRVCVDTTAGQKAICGYCGAEINVWVVTAYRKDMLSD